MHPGDVFEDRAVQLRPGHAEEADQHRSAHYQHRSAGGGLKMWASSRSYPPHQGVDLRCSASIICAARSHLRELRIARPGPPLPGELPGDRMVHGSDELQKTSEPPPPRPAAELILGSHRLPAHWRHRSTNAGYAGSNGHTLATTVPAVDRSAHRPVATRMVPSPLRPARPGPGDDSDSRGMRDTLLRIRRAGMVRSTAAIRAAMLQHRGPVTLSSAGPSLLGERRWMSSCLRTSPASGVGTRREGSPMRQIRITKRQRPAPCWLEPLPLDPRDPDIVRAKQLARRASPSRGGQGARGPDHG